MFDPHTHPVAGRPRTATMTDKDGHPRFTIKPWVLTPFRAQAADAISSLVAWSIFCAFVLWLFNNHKLPAGVIIAHAAFGFIGYKALAMLVHLLMHRSARIVMSTGSISVKRWYGWQRFDRNLEHRFALLIHDKSQAEKLRHDLQVRRASANGRVVQKKAYYAESFHVVLLYAGHRRDLLSVYGQKDATAIVARLQYCDRCINEAARMGGGIKQRPEDEWNDEPGGIV